MMKIKPDERILEVGIGTGALLPFYARDVDLIGIDVCQEMLDRAELLRGRLGMTNTILLNMDATRLEFADDAFDKVMAAYVISVVPDPIAVGEGMGQARPPGDPQPPLVGRTANPPPARLLHDHRVPGCDRRIVQDQVVVGVTAQTDTGAVQPPSYDHGPAVGDGDLGHVHATGQPTLLVEPRNTS